MHISLKPVTIENVELIRAWAADPYYGEFFRRFPPVFTWGEDQAVISTFVNSYFIRQDDNIVGLCSLINVDNISKSVEYGVLLEKESKETVKTLFESSDKLKDYVFNYLDFNKAYCTILKHRKDLISLFELNGMKFEAELKESCFWQGKFWDEVRYYQLKREFNKGDK